MVLQLALYIMLSRQMARWVLALELLEMRGKSRDGEALGYMTNAKTFQTGVPAMEHWISAILLVFHTRILSDGVEIAAALSLVTFANDWLKERSHNTGKCKLLPLA